MKMFFKNDLEPATVMPSGENMEFVEQSEIPEIIPEPKYIDGESNSTKDAEINEDGEELAEHVIAFAVVEDEILMALQDGRMPQDYLIKNLQPSVPLMQPVPIHPFPYNQQPPCFSYIPGIFNNEVVTPSPFPISQLTKLSSCNQNLNDYDTDQGNSAKPKSNPYYNQNFGPKLPEEIQTQKCKTDTEESQRSNSNSKLPLPLQLPSMWVTVDDPLISWTDCDSYERKGIECDKIKLTKLPCCTEYASEMVCISSKPWPHKQTPSHNQNSVSNTDTELDQQDGRFQNQLLRTFEQYEEVQNQLSAICFAKPELLTSSTTLCSINTSKVGPVDDLLRRSSKAPNHGFRFSSTDNKENDIDCGNNNLNNLTINSSLRKSRGRKPLKQLLEKYYIPRSPLPFEKIFDLSTEPLTSEPVNDKEKDMEPVTSSTDSTGVTPNSNSASVSVKTGTLTGISTSTCTVSTTPSFTAAKRKRSSGNQTKCLDVTPTSNSKANGAGMGGPLQEKNFKKPKSKKNTTATAASGPCSNSNPSLSKADVPATPGSSASPSPSPSSLSLTPSPASTSTSISLSVPPPTANQSDPPLLVPKITPKKSPFEWLDAYFTTNSVNDQSDDGRL